MVMLIASTVLVVKAIHRAMPPTVKIQDSTIVIYNNTSTNAWSNVPIEITSLGGNNYRVTNKSAMGIKRFIIALYAGTLGKPLHGEGAQRHFVPVRVMDNPIIAPGKSIDINIEEQLKLFTPKSHHEVDTSRIEMWPHIIEFDGYSPTKRWINGKYYRATKDNWEEDPDLNPKENRVLSGIRLDC